ncbi:hypothetical protein C8J57DRAFT_1517717 [Mycena rebaudengoi]|nr:hypothetical protein C8J57DRAFT_1517717 [Mycena rebaudengoi]
MSVVLEKACPTLPRSRPPPPAPPPVSLTVSAVRQPSTRVPSGTRTVTGGPPSSASSRTPPPPRDVLCSGMPNLRRDCVLPTSRTSVYTRSICVQRFKRGRANIGWSA